MMMNGDTIIDRATGEVLDLEVDSTYGRNKLEAAFITFVDYKITCCKVGGLHVLNGTNNLDT